MVFNSKERFLSEIYVINIICRTCMLYQFDEEKSICLHDQKDEKKVYFYVLDVSAG